MIWDKYVALKLLPFAVLGICLSEFVWVTDTFSVYWLLPVVVVLFFLSRFKQPLAKTIFAVLVFLLIALLGFCRHSFRHQIKSDLPFFQKSTGSIVRLVSDAEQKANSTAYQVRILRVQTDSTWRDVHQKGMLYVGMDSTVEKYSYGDVLFVEGSWEEISGPLNPNSFDFQKFMARKGVFLSQFQYPSRIHPLDSGYIHPILTHVHDFRAYFEQTLIANGFKGDEFGVAKAVITGDKAHVTNDLLDKYSASGSMHVLAVSGLHVGIIYLIFFHLLRPLSKLPHGVVLRLILLVMLLWFYALFTGMSASVVRASTMFTAVAFAQSVKRITNIYNTIALSALVLLLFRPTLLFEVGFQLSYTAVLGIVSFQPIFSSWWSPKSKVLKWIYDLICVSIAAQLATFPIALGTFNQFPNLFLLSNLWVIPMITVVLYIGVTLILINSLIPIPHFLFLIWRSVIEMMNWGVDRIESIPFSATDAIWISKSETFGIYALVIGLFFLLKTRGTQKAIIWFSLSFCLFYYHRVTYDEPLKEITFYSIPAGFALDIAMNDQRMFVYTDSIYQSKDYRFHIQGNHLASEDRIMPVPMQDTLLSEGLYFREPYLIGLDWTLQWWREQHPTIPVDYTVIDRQTGFINLEEIELQFLGKVILSCEISNGKAAWLEKSLTDRGVEVINLSRGSYSEQIN
jgi:competence protein ComEC